MELEEALKEIENLKEQATKDANDLEAMRKKSADLLDETKQAKHKAKEEAERLAKVEAEKALQSGDHKQLLEIAQLERDKAIEEATQAKQSLEESTIAAINAKHAQEVSKFGLTFDPLNDHSLSDLSGRIKSRTKIIDGDIKVLDRNGDLTVSTLEQLKSEMIASGEVSHLIKGNQSSGGDASGGSSQANQPNLSSTQKIAAGLAKLN